jgi:hypothetical protein
MGDEQKKSEVELQRLDEFVKQAPSGDYNIDQEKQRICRQLGSGQEKCVNLNLEGMVLFYSLLVCMEEERGIHVAVNGTGWWRIVNAYPSGWPMER